MKINEEDISSQTSTEKTSISSSLEDTSHGEKKSQNLLNNDNSNMDNNNKSDINRSKKKKLSKKNTINYFSPANEFQKTTLEKNNLIESNNMRNSFGISLKPLEEQWNYQKILLDYNILDFTSKFDY